MGGPTILATFTVIAALLPMAFVSGLMGPYMSPIPINASMGMVISLARRARVHALAVASCCSSHAGATAARGAGGDSRLHRFFERVMAPFLRGDGARPNRRKLYLGIAGRDRARGVAGRRAVGRHEDAALRQQVGVPGRRRHARGHRRSRRPAACSTSWPPSIAGLPEVTDYQVYAGTSAPINFNGLVRQYYLRSGPELGDIQVNLVDKHHRDRQSHEIAPAVRPALADDRRASTARR